MEPIFIRIDRALVQSLLVAGENFGTDNGNGVSSMLELQNTRKMEFLQDLCMLQHHSDEAVITSVLDAAFWESLDLSSLSVIIVLDGVCIFRGDYTGSVTEHQQLISNVDQYSLYMEELYVHDNVVAMEASDPAQDWISQEMIKPHVLTIQEMLQFTNVQMRNGLESLHRRGEVINFVNLLDVLILTEDAVVNVYVGTRKYAFSADVKLVLHECFDRYGREPTMEEFDQEWNLIKGTGIEHLINLVGIERARAEEEAARAEEEAARAIIAHREKVEAMRQINTAMEDRNEAQQLMNAAIDEIIQAKDREETLEEEKRRAEEEKLEALNREALLEEEKRRAEEEKLEALNREALLVEEKRRAEEEKRRAEEEKRRAEEEIVQRIKKEAMLEEELMRERMREQIRAELFEQERRKFEEEKLLMAAQFEEEKKILLSRIQQISGCAQA